MTRRSWAADRAKIRPPTPLPTDWADSMRRIHGTLCAGCGARLSRPAGATWSGEAVCAACCARTVDAPTPQE